MEEIDENEDFLNNTTFPIDENFLNNITLPIDEDFLNNATFRIDENEYFLNNITFQIDENFLNNITLPIDENKDFLNNITFSNNVNEFKKEITKKRRDERVKKILLKNKKLMLRGYEVKKNTFIFKRYSYPKKNNNLRDLKTGKYIKTTSDFIPITKIPIQHLDK